MIRSILWDNDGVLVDTEGLYFRATAEVMRERGLALTEADYRRFFLVESSGLRALIPDIDAPGLEAIRARRNQVYARLLETGEITVPGAAEVLAALDGRYHMAVVTSSLREHFEIIHRRTGFLPRFRFVLASGDYEEPKPHPAPYLAAIARLAAEGITPEECVVIEDSLRGLTAARAAGLRTWVIPGPLTDPGDFADADLVFASIRDLPAALIADRTAR